VDENDGMVNEYPPVDAGERESLQRFLDFHRLAVLDAPRSSRNRRNVQRPLPNSDMTVPGIIKHLARMEDLWFGHKLTGRLVSEPWASAPFQADPDWDFHSAGEDSIEYVRDLYSQACEASRELSSNYPSLDHKAAMTSFGSQRVSLRWIYLHMIEETAQHRGHLDLLLDATAPV
jgi:uncharacterized damage-inducible protein DinB